MSYINAKIIIHKKALHFLRIKLKQGDDFLERVVVTEYELFQRLEQIKETFWENAVQGTNGINPIESLDTSDYPH